MDLNNWTEGWAVWNFILDEQNGPRHAGGISARGRTIVNADIATGGDRNAACKFTNTSVPHKIGSMAKCCKSKRG